MIFNVFSFSKVDRSGLLSYGSLIPLVFFNDFISLSKSSSSSYKMRGMNGGLSNQSVKYEQPLFALQGMKMGDFPLLILRYSYTLRLWLNNLHSFPEELDEQLFLFNATLQVIHGEWGQVAFKMIGVGMSDYVPYTYRRNFFPKQMITQEFDLL